MTNPVANRTVAPGDALRLSAYVRIAREQAGAARSPNAMALRQRGRKRDDADRAARYGRLAAAPEA